MNRIIFETAFLFDKENKLYLNIKPKWQGNIIDLTLSSFLTFLYQYENDINKADSDFCYVIAKLLKKTHFNDDEILAISDDYDMAYFFRKALEHEVDVYWWQDNELRPILFNSTLPITIVVERSNLRLSCQMTEHRRWVEDPLKWLSFSDNKDMYCFSDGVLVKNPDEELLTFLDQFLDKGKFYYEAEDVEGFIKEIYKVNKNALFWQIKVDFSDFLPEEIEPQALLTLTYDNRVLSPSLSYKYKHIEVKPEDTEMQLYDSNNGKKLYAIKGVGSHLSAGFDAAFCGK